MGWTGIYGDFKNAEEFFRDCYSQEFADGRIVDFVIAGGGDAEKYFERKEVYAAYRRQDGSVSAFVALIEHPSGAEWLIKDITEDEGPVARGCPHRILRQLDEPRIGTHAAQWRKDCGDTRTWPTVEDKISDIVADGILEKAPDDMAAEIREFLEKTYLDDEEKREAIAKAEVVCMTISQPGCLPDFSSVHVPDKSGNWYRAFDIAEEITSAFEDDFEDEGDWEEFVSEIKSDCHNVTTGVKASCGGSLPDGSKYEVYTQSCEDVLKEHGAYPAFGTEGPKS